MVRCENSKKLQQRWSVTFPPRIFALYYLRACFMYLFTDLWSGDFGQLWCNCCWVTGR